MDVGESSKTSFSTKNSKNNEKFKCNIKCIWKIGDLVWARFDDNPYWPCVITNDPTETLFYKSNNKNEENSCLVHVNFFNNQTSHAWVSSTSVIKFTTLNAFKKMFSSLTPESRKNNPSHAAAFIVKPGLKVSWDEAISNASQVKILSNEQRALMFTNESIKENILELIEEAKKKKASIRRKNTSSKRKIEISPQKENLYKPRNTKRSQTAKEKYELREEDNEKLVTGDFNVYFDRMKDFVALEHPDADDQELRLYLAKIWDGLSYSTKIYYQ